VNSPDVIIGGAGIIGVSIALELHRRGARVMLLDRGEPGCEASSAAAGMLSAADPETPAKLRALVRESASLFPEFVRQIEEKSALKTDFRRRGTIALEQHLPAPPEYRQLSTDALRELEPSLENVGCTAFVVEEDSVDPALLMRAALRAAENLGIELRSNSEVREMRSREAQVEVITADERFLAKAAVNCQGAWSGVPVRPRKGQMLYLQPERSGILEHVVRAPDAYIVPRSTGKILVGATVEDTGFEKSVQPETIRALHQAACKYLPRLASAQISASWAGLRPGSPDDLPLLGRTEQPGVFIASGHFRNGILLAPVTALIMADLIAGKTPAIDISSFSPARFVNTIAGPA